MPSRYPVSPLSFEGLQTVQLKGRGGKVNTTLFAKPIPPGGATAWLNALPQILAADTLRAVVAKIREAKAKGKPILWGFGGHLVKVGLAPVLLQLADAGYVQGLHTNGSGSIHDFEIALAGYTSEDVESVLPNGAFGSAEETGREMNLAIRAGAADRLGMGEALGRALESLADPQFAGASLLYGAYRRNIPFTVHVALGTDTPHTHPHADGAAIGQTSFQDFQLFCSLVAGLHEGGVYLNVGSAVVMPEVFLKAISVVRNLGNPVRNFTTVNFDFLQHYRPSANVVHRPHANAGGKGYAITGHHEILVPLLAALLLEDA